MKNMFKLLSLLAVLFMSSTSIAEQFMPAQLFMMDEYFSHHIIIVEKSTHKLHLYKNDNGLPKLQKTYSIATGKKSGDKSFQGDYRTPEGIYNFTDFLTRDDLIKRHGKAGEIYGVGAFVMDYPNIVDRRQGKNGGGIWLHSTNDETRIDKGLDSRGCVVAHNSELIEISEYLELNKSKIIVTDKMNFLSKESWIMQKDMLHQAITSWLDAWKTEDLKSYLSSYHPKEFSDRYKGNFKNFSNYKRAVFANPGTPEIDIQNLSLLVSNDYAVATFKQIYKSKTITDTGRKILFLKKDEYYNWKIIAESWSKMGIDPENSQVAFSPSMRFFKTNDPAKILGNTAQKEKN